MGELASSWLHPLKSWSLRKTRYGSVFEDRVKAGQWRVEWFDDDGRCELEIFVGPTGRQDALRYAMQKYGHFEEVQLEPYPPSSQP
jgi:hypothetical protein